ncbi:AfsR/SARP family transcriptional regulator [Streptomyces hiroshimensis]|uniref:Regulatory protein AfsR n=1 Tax=Streptomyces hiroshimensis TaxID=66424 RepID=A0ABQ2YAG6_9ACTN|nr:AfsR/SARP family transcriptional regulator [Streptomyces hiroshimensis]GGX74871.1 regulatory protein AfsR [Streptomyces hiroshimensis]
METHGDPHAERRPSEAVAPAFRFSLLGPVRAWRDGAEICLGRPQQREVLAVLLGAARRTVSLPLIAEGVWDEADRPSRPNQSVRTHVYRLRGVLGHSAETPLLVTVGDGYALRVPADAVDTWEFEQAEAEAGRLRAAGGTAEQARDVLAGALELWSAEPLAGLHGPHARAERDRLGAVRQSLLEARLELDAEIGDRPDLHAEAGDLVIEYPASQRLRGVQMLALYQAGRQAEALSVYEDTRRFLEARLAHLPPSEHRPCAALRELHQRILRAEPATGAGVPARAALTAEGVPGTHRLPPGIDDFTGRSEAVGALTGMLTHPGAQAIVISAVNGVPGVGKTALAVHAARQVAERFPDGYLYADLRGADREPLAAQAVLVSFLPVLGVVDGEIPADADERIALYRSLMAERRVLVLLDNAASDDQVQPLVPGSGRSTVLVTSRARLTGLTGAQHLRLDVMPPGEAVELLGRIAGERRCAAEPEAAADIVAACSRLPLAIRVVASRLAAEPGTPLSAMVRRLGDEHRRLGELSTGELAVEATFELSYSKLSREQARAFRLLSAVEAPDLGLHCAAALLGRDPKSTEDLLESLVDLNLVESRRMGRYHFHDLMRVFARARNARDGSPAGTSGAFARLLDFCLATARTADAASHSVDPAERRLIDVPVTAAGLRFGSAQAATDWMHEEIPVQRALIDRACADESLPLAQAADLVDKLNNVLPGTAHQTGVIDQAGHVAAVAAARGDRTSEALARYVCGNALWHTNAFAEAESELRRSIALCDDAGDAGDAGDTEGTGSTRDARLRGWAHLTLCAGARVRGRTDEAVEHGEAAVRLFRFSGAGTAEGTALGELAFNYARQARLAEARTAAERGARLVGREPSVSKAIGLYYLARVLRLCDDLGGALHRAQEALELFRSLNVPAFEAATGALIADLHVQAGRHRLAADVAETFLPVARRTSGILEASLLRALARGLVHLGQRARARTCLEAALGLFEQRQAQADADQTRALLMDLMDLTDLR